MEGGQVKGKPYESSLHETEEEPSQDHAGEVLRDPRQGRDQAPEQHRARDVQRRPRDAVDEHVRRHLHEDVPDVEDAQASRVLGVVQVEVVLQTAQPGRRDVVAV